MACGRRGVASRVSAILDMCLSLRECYKSNLAQTTVRQDERSRRTHRTTFDTRCCGGCIMYEAAAAKRDTAVCDCKTTAPRTKTDDDSPAHISGDCDRRDLRTVHIRRLRTDGPTDPARRPDRLPACPANFRPMTLLPRANDDRSSRAEQSIIYDDDNEQHKSVAVQLRGQCFIDASILPRQSDRPNVYCFMTGDFSTTNG